MKIKNEHGFTLIEMMIVIMIISILLLIIVPNITKNSDVVASKSCDATIKLLQSQVAAYEVETGNTPTDLAELKENGYVESITCPDNTKLIIDNGIVKKSS